MTCVLMLIDGHSDGSEIYSVADAVIWRGLASATP
jgi:hypothetical protein